ncbi:MAG: DUF4271 domain-containing protein [Candidatus Cyclobacteriaceae bacterium M2_1C_046]
MKKFIITGILFLYTFISWSQENWALLQNLNENWFYYDEQWKPVTDQFDEYDAIYFKTGTSGLAGKYLIIQHPGRFAVFLDEKIIVVEDDSLALPLDSLQRHYQFNPNTMLSIHAPQLEAQNLKTLLMTRYFTEGEPEVDDIINIEKREAINYYSFFAVAFLLVLILLTVIKVYYPRHFMDFYNIGKTLSARDTDESFLRGRLFSRINLMIMILQCFIVGLFISLFIIFLDVTTEERYKSFTDYLSLWVNASLFVAGFIIIKFLLIRNFTSLYNMGNFSTPHFISYMRIISQVFGLAIVLFYIGIYGIGWQTSQPFNTLINVVLILLALSIGFIYLKLINNSSYKLLHLFSYLCATEILPYVVVLKLAINHSI